MNAEGITKDIKRGSLVIPINYTTWDLKPESLPSNLFVIRQHIASFWPQSLRRHPELYALGIDAYHLIDQLNQLSQSPQVGFSGATGTLFLTPNGHIFRQLLWAKMINGNPVLLNP